MTPREHFMQVVSALLYPQLRQDGFRGSGETLRRQRQELLHVINIQGSSSGARCYLNLGAHLAFLPKAGGGTCDPKRIKEYECAFRTRVDPPPEFEFGWPYGANQREAEHIVTLLTTAFTQQGRAFFATFAEFPASFSHLTPDLFRDSIGTRKSFGATPLHWARIFIHLHDKVRARAFCELGLQTAPERAVSYRAELKNVLAAT